MATKTTTIRELIDDMDGRTKTGVQTVSFALNGVDYEIDLGPRYQRSLQHVLDPFIKNARLAGTKKKTRSTGTSKKNPDSARIRQWAKDEGYDIPARGRIPGFIINDYYNEVNAA